MSGNKGKGKPKKIEPFPLGVGAMLMSGVEGLKRAPLPLLLGSLLPIAISAPMLFWGQGRLTEVDTSGGFSTEAAGGLFLLFLGFVIAGTMSYPVCAYALQVARNEPVDIRAPFQRPDRFVTMLVSSFWFWAGILLSFNFVFIPFLPAFMAVFVFVFYVFFGFVVADRPDLGGMKVLGVSSRIGDKRRVALFGLTALYAAVFAFVAVLGFSIGGGEATVVAAVGLYAALLLFVSFALVGWATLYDVLRKDLPDAW